MALLKLDIQAVRNIENQSILPAPGFNFIFGENASGKSALVEAIYILGRAKSFRTSNIKSVINFNQPHLLVTGLTRHVNGNSFHIGTMIDGKNFTLRINGQSSQNRSDLAYTLPLQLIYPKSYELLDAGSQIRREFLDWGVFNNEINFLAAWRKFKRSLSQRNALLKTRQYEYIKVWDKELVYYGTIVNGFRQDYLSKLQPVFVQIASQFLSVENINIKLVSGWDISIPYELILQSDLEKDLRYGFTHSGPHRADFHLLVNNLLARDYVSRGQLKLLVICLKLAQVQLLSNDHNNSVSILIDDFAAELDYTNREKLLHYLEILNTQVFITTTDKNDFSNLLHLSNYKMFHVEHGNIKSV